MLTLQSNGLIHEIYAGISPQLVLSHSSPSAIIVLCIPATTMTATGASPDASASPSPSSRINLRNPTPLSAIQEAEVRDLYYKRVRGHCAAEIKEFADCARNRTISTTWACRKERLAMNSCMIAHATPEEEDRAREEWFANRDARRQQREKEEREKEERRRQVIQMMKEAEEQKAEAKKSSGSWFWKGFS
ncbi:hypothetical protein VTO42DRAFT_2996 [Malbranchea cinnamomea]